MVCNRDVFDEGVCCRLERGCEILCVTVLVSREPSSATLL